MSSGELLDGYECHIKAILSVAVPLSKLYTHICPFSAKFNTNRSDSQRSGPLAPPKTRESKNVS